MITATVDVVKCYFVFEELIVVTATVDILQCYCVVCGVYCGDSNSRYSAMVLCLCVEFIVVTATVDTVQWYCVACGVYCG